MNEPAKATFYGYISTTQDALLIFECVRRGLLPKLNRRLREEERGLIRSGHIFVFDERESGIKRWTDGLLWSPSRILLNFLVYRQIEKKPGKGGDKAAREAAQAQGSGSSSSSSSIVDPLAMGVGPSKRASTSSSSSSHRHGHALEGSSGSGSGSNEAGPSGKDKSHLRSLSNGSSSSLAAAGVVDMGSKPGNKAAAAESSSSAWAASSASAAAAAAAKKHSDMEERSIVGSLTNSYPFAKDGLCKKTISIQVEGSTQHLISYYSVDDVRSGRLRTPSSLPEIAALAISPMFLNKATFRFPPAIVVGPDGIPRYSGEGTENSNSPRKPDPGGGSSSGEGSGGSNLGHDARYGRAPPTASPMTFSPSDPFPPAAQAPPYDAMSPEALPGSAFAAPFYPSAPSGAVSGARLEDTRPAPLPHQIGGSGIAPLARRASDSPLRARSGSGRFEPYAYTPTPAAGEGSGVMSPRMGSSGRAVGASQGMIHGWPAAAQPSAMVSQHSQGSSGPTRRLQSSRSLWNLNEAQQAPPPPQDTSSGFQAATLAAASASSSPAPVILRPSSSQQAVRPFTNIDWRGVRSPVPSDDGGAVPSNFPNPSAEAGWQSTYPSRPSSSLAQPYEATGQMQPHEAATQMRPHEAASQMQPPQNTPTQSQQQWSSLAPNEGFSSSPYVAATHPGGEEGSNWGAPRASISSMASSIHEELGLGEAQRMYDVYGGPTAGHAPQAPPPQPSSFQPFGGGPTGMYGNGDAAQQLLGSLDAFAQAPGGGASGDQALHLSPGGAAQQQPQSQHLPPPPQEQHHGYALPYDSEQQMLAHQQQHVGGQQRDYDGQAPHHSMPRYGL